MIKTIKHFFIDSNSLANLGDISSRMIEIRKYINLYGSTNNIMMLQNVHKKTFEVLRIFFDILNNNDINGFSHKLSAISEICKNIENISHDILPMLLRGDNVARYYEKIEVELTTLLDISGFTKNNQDC